MMLIFHGDGVDVRRIGGKRQFDARRIDPLLQLADQLLDSFRSAMLDDVIQRLQPFAGFDLFNGHFFIWIHGYYAHLVPSVCVICGCSGKIFGSRLDAQSGKKICR